MAENKATFGRKWLAGIIRNEDLSPEEKEQQIMEGHIGVTDGLKDRIEELKTEADKVPALQKQLQEANGGEDFKKKYEDEHKAFEDFKKQTASAAETEKVKEAFRGLLSDEKISGSKDRIDAIIRATDFSGMKLGEDGKLVNEADVRAAINKDWGEFKQTVTQQGAKVENPPKTGKATMTVDEIMAIQDTGERQKAIFENKELFGIT